MIIMSYKTTYKYFLAALNEWIKGVGTGHQKILALEINRTKGYISQLLNPERQKPISFEIQNDLATACGYDYLDFLQLGKELLEGKPEENITKKISKPASIDPAIEILQEFLQEEGKEIVMEKAGPLIQIVRDMLADVDNGKHGNITKITAEHQELIKKFKDQEAGKEANEWLLQLEKLNKRKFYALIGDIKGIVIEEQEKHEEPQSGKKTGTS